MQTDWFVAELKVPTGQDLHSAGLPFSHVNDVYVPVGQVKLGRQSLHHRMLLALKIVVSRDVHGMNPPPPKGQPEASTLGVA